MLFSFQSAQTAHTRQLCVCFYISGMHPPPEGVHIQRKDEAFNIYVIYAAHFIASWGCYVGKLGPEIAGVSRTWTK